MTKKANRKEIVALSMTGLVILVSVIGIVIFAKAGRTNKEIETDGEVAVQEKVNKEEKVKEEYTEKSSDGSKVNTSKEMQRKKELDGLEINNIQLKEKGGITTLLADIENKTNVLTLTTHS